MRGRITDLLGYKEISCDGNTWSYTERTGSATPDIIVWEEDLTHDGKLERIEVNLESGATGEVDTVTVYPGDSRIPESGRPIWTAYADTVHAGWNGIYVYQNPRDVLTYLLVWQPSMYQGVADYHYRVFSLSESGKEQIWEEASIAFDLNHVKMEDPGNVSSFLARVNELLRESYVLIDTNEGVKFYSEQGNRVTREFDADSIVAELKRARFAQMGE